MSRTVRVIVCLLIAVTAMSLQGCGRKEKLTPPRGSDYPRQYPRE